MLIYACMNERLNDYIGFSYTGIDENVFIFKNYKEELETGLTFQ